jgi:ABC-type amino acid transport substrate-binding protein
MLTACCVINVKAAPDISFVAPILTPYAYYDSEGKLTGTQVELVNKINQISAFKLDVFPVPATRLMRTIRSGKADLAILIESKAANELGKKITLITKPSFMIVSLKSAKTVSSLGELKGHTVGYISSAFYGENFDNQTDIYKVPLLDNVKALDMLLLKRIDYLATSERGLVYLLNEKKCLAKLNLSLYSTRPMLICISQKNLNIILSL